MHTQVHLKLLIMMEIQSITNVVSIHKSITSLTHLIDHSYCQAWSALLAAAILKMHLYFYIATDPNSCEEWEHETIGSQMTVLFYLSIKCPASLRWALSWENTDDICHIYIIYIYIYIYIERERERERDRYRDREREIERDREGERDR